MHKNGGMFLTPGPLLQAHLDAGTIRCESTSYVARASDGTLVFIGEDYRPTTLVDLIDREFSRIEWYLAQCPNPEHW